MMNPRHSIVDKNQWPGRPGFVSFFQHLQRDRTVGHQSRFDPVSTQDFFENLPTGVVVVDHENFKPVENCGQSRSILTVVGRPLELCRKLKHAAFAMPAFESDAALHLFDKLLTDRQAKTCAAKFAGRRTVGLSECLENG